MADILKGVKVKGLSLWFEKEKVLVIADLHIGYEEALNKEGVLVPRFQCHLLEKSLKLLLKSLKPSSVIINGDLKHEFGMISEQEWRETLKVLGLIEKYCKGIIIIKGNHDTILGPIAKKKNIKLANYAIVNDCYITHGDIIPDDEHFRNAKAVIIGHEHPAVGLREGSKLEKFKCFIKGDYNKKILIVMPSFNFVTEGSDIITEAQISPFLQQNLDNFKVFIVCEGKVYDFNTVRYVKRH